MLRDEVLEALAAKAVNHGYKDTAIAIRAEDWTNSACIHTALASAEAALAVIDQYEALEGWTTGDDTFFPAGPFSLGGCAIYTARTMYRKKPEPEPVPVPRETLALMLESVGPAQSEEQQEAIAAVKRLLT